MKKILGFILCVALVASCVVAIAACNPDSETYYWGEGKDVAASDKTQIVYLGDSIAEGILGASPLPLRHEYAYGNVIGRRNDYSYANHSVSGHLTDDMLELISNEVGYDGARMLVSNIATADIVHISIIGNDILQDRPDVELVGNPYGDYVSMHQVVCDAMIRDNYDGLNLALYGTTDESGTAGSYGNIVKIVERLIELNPDAVIIFQKVYNPIFSEDTPLVKSWTRTALANAGVEVTLESLHTLGDNLISRMNAVIQKVIDKFNADKASSAKWTLTSVDALAAFNEIYETDGADRAWGLIYPDGIHPSDEGHAVLADLTQAKLEELGLANSTAALLGYKIMRMKFLLENFGDKLENKWEAVANVMSATSCAEVTKVFFAATDGVTPDYDIDHSAPSSPKEVIETHFRIDPANTSVWGITGTTINLILDSEKSGIFLRNDGTMSLRLILSDEATGIINGLLGSFLGGSVDLSSFQNTYLTPIAPGASLDDIEGLLDIAYDCLGLRLIGFDMNDPGIAALVNGLQTGKLPSSLDIPAGFGVELNYNYTMKKVQDATGKVYDAVYLTPYDSDTQPFIVMTMESKTYNNKVDYDIRDIELDQPVNALTLNFKVDFVKLNFTAVQNLPELFEFE